MFFHMDIWYFQQHLLKINRIVKTIISQLNCPWSFVKDQLAILCRSISGLSFQIHWSVYLFFHQY